MKYRLLNWLACPSCRDPDLTLETGLTRTEAVCASHFEEAEADLPGVDLERREEQVVIDGALHCKSCGAVYPIRDGIPRMLPSGADEGPETAHRWTEFDSEVPEWEENFLDLAQPLRPADFLGKLALDAGCGFGRHAFYAARYGAEVVGLDSSMDGLLSAQRNTRGLQRIHLVQGDLRRPPLRDRAFDLVYCFGVLHHLDQPRDIFRGIGQLARPGGRVSLWVYGPRQGATHTANLALRGVTNSLQPDELHRVSKGIASGLRLFSHTPYRLLRHVPIAGPIVSHLPVHDHHRWPYDVVVADVYDRLRVPVKHWFRGEELEVWMAEDGYLDVHVSRRVGNNETFRATGIRR